MPTVVQRKRRLQRVQTAEDALDLLRRYPLWLPAWTVAQELGFTDGRMVRGALELLVEQGHAEVASPYSDGHHAHRYYRAL